MRNQWKDHIMAVDIYIYIYISFSECILYIIYILFEVVVEMRCSLRRTFEKSRRWKKYTL